MDERSRQEAARSFNELLRALNISRAGDASDEEDRDEVRHDFKVVEASISDILKALKSGEVTAVELACQYLLRISAFDIHGPMLNSFTLINPNVLDEARASDEYRASGRPARPLEGVPYTLKDSYKYMGMAVAAGSPAFEYLMPNENAFVAEKLREAGAILIGKTNMPPMAAGGTQRGLYGRAESPYNKEFLTAAYCSGSSSGAATSTAASFAAFGMGGESISCGRSSASNNGLVAYTPSRGVISCRGVWPLYGTCDVLVPLTRSIEDLLAILPVITEHDPKVKGDFWREQCYVKLPRLNFNWSSIRPRSLEGKRIGVPRMYIGEQWHDGKITHVSLGVMQLWDRARGDLEDLGAEVVLCDFPLVTRYEDDSVSHETHNVVDAPPHWQSFERGILVAKIWDKFLQENGNIGGLTEADPKKLFPNPFTGATVKFVDQRNLIHYPSLIQMAKWPGGLFDVPKVPEGLKALEAQRKRDLEDWMDEQDFDFIVFPANGDVGKADLEENMYSASHGMQNGVGYSNGNKVIRHLGVPTVSVTMGTLLNGMPVNLTFAGKAYTDDKLISYAYSYEQQSKRRVSPRLTPELVTQVNRRPVSSVASQWRMKREPKRIIGAGEVDIYAGTKRFQIPEGYTFEVDTVPEEALPQPLGRLVDQQRIVLVIGRRDDGHADARLFLC